MGAKNDVIPPGRAHTYAGAFSRRKFAFCDLYVCVYKCWECFYKTRSESVPTLQPPSRFPWARTRVGCGGVKRGDIRRGKKWNKRCWIPRKWRTLSRESLGSRPILTVYTYSFTSSLHLTYVNETLNAADQRVRNGEKEGLSLSVIYCPIQCCPLMISYAPIQYSSYPLFFSLVGKIL